MSRNTYYPQSYKCHQCGEIQKHYVWASECDSTRHSCIKCNAQLNYQNMYQDVVDEAPSIGGKMTSAQIRIDRQKRSHQDFVKNVYPTLSRKDKAHFKKKGADK